MFSAATSELTFRRAPANASASQINFHPAETFHANGNFETVKRRPGTRIFLPRAPSTVWCSPKYSNVYRNVSPEEVQLADTNNKSLAEIEAKSDANKHHWPSCSHHYSSHRLSTSRSRVTETRVCTQARTRMATNDTCFEI